MPDQEQLSTGAFYDELERIREGRSDLAQESITNRLGKQELTPDYLGRVAWSAYRKQVGGVSKFTGDALPEWDGVDSDIKEAWEQSAIAVLAAVVPWLTAESGV